MIDEMKARIEAWAFRGPLWAQMLKTAATHALVWGLGTVVGSVVGGVLLVFAGLHAIWAFTFTLAGFGVGARFYLGREAGDVAAFLASPEHGSLAKLGLKIADSGLDLIVPLAFNAWIVTLAARVFGLL